MKIGSRPIWRIARTGELTPPASTSTARRKSSLERSVETVLRLPARVVVGEVVQAHLLVLGRGVQRGPIGPLQAALVGDRVEDRVALLLRAPMGHREDAVGPVGVGGPLVAVRDAAEGGHAPPGLEDLVLGHLP